jgi:hypothetical protein
VLDDVTAAAEALAPVSELKLATRPLEDTSVAKEVSDDTTDDAADVLARPVT